MSIPVSIRIRFDPLARGFDLSAAVGEMGLRTARVASGAPRRRLGGGLAHYSLPSSRPQDIARTPTLAIPEKRNHKEH